MTSKLISTTHVNNLKALSVGNSTGTSMISFDTTNMTTSPPDYIMVFHTPTGSTALPADTFIYLDNAKTAYIRFVDRTADSTNYISFLTGSGELQLYSDGTCLLNGVQVATTALSLISLADGAEATPSLNFSGDTNTGVYRPTTDSFGITCGGVKSIIFDTVKNLSYVPLRCNFGSISDPSLQFVGDATPLGWYHPIASNRLNFAINGNDIINYFATKVRYFEDIELFNANLFSNSGHSINFDTTYINYDVNSTVDEHKFSVDAVDKVVIDDDGLKSKSTIYMFDGAPLTDPSIAFENHTLTGLKYLATDGISFLSNNAQILGYDSNKIYANQVVEFTPATFSIANTTGSNKLQFVPATNTITFDTNSTTRLTITTAIVSASLPYQTASGSNTAPAFSFNVDTNSGMYRIGADNIGFATNGTLRADISTTALTSTLPIIHPAGTAAAPSVSFTGDTNSGIYSSGADQVGVSCGGAQVLNVNTLGITYSGLSSSMGAFTQTFNLTTTVAQSITNFKCLINGYANIKYSSSSDTFTFAFTQAVDSGGQWYSTVTAGSNVTVGGADPNWTLTIINGTGTALLLAMNTSTGVWTIANNVSTTQTIVMEYWRL